MKITIVGGPGSGKSTLGKRISDKLQIPYLQIDRLWFETGGNMLKEHNVREKEEVREFIKEKVSQFIQQEKWVSDGWYSRVQPEITNKADVLIFLDIPLHKRIWNHVKRVCRTDRHSELTLSDDLLFILEIIRRYFKVMPKIRKFVKENNKKAIIITKYTEIDKYISEL